MSVVKSQLMFTPFASNRDAYVFSLIFGPAAPSDDKWESERGDLAYMLDMTKVRTFKHPLSDVVKNQALMDHVHSTLKDVESVIVVIAPDGINFEYYTHMDEASDAWCELTGLCSSDDDDSEYDDDRTDLDALYPEDDDEEDEYEPILDDEEEDDGAKTEN